MFFLIEFIPSGNVTDSQEKCIIAPFIQKVYILKYLSLSDFNLLIVKLS